MGLGEAKRSQSVRGKRTEAQQGDNQAIQYRGLNALIAHNMCLLLKSHKNALGDMDPPSRFKISNEELGSAVDNAAKLYQKMADKLNREPVLRNAPVRRTYEEYYRAYKTLYPHYQQQPVRRSDYVFTEQVRVSSMKVTRKSTSVNSNRPSSSKPAKKTAVIPQQFFEGVESMQSIASSQIFKQKEKESKMKALLRQNPQHNIIRRHTGFPRKEDYSRERKRFFQSRKRYEDQPNQAKIAFLDKMADEQGQTKGHRRSSSGMEGNYLHRSRRKIGWMTERNGLDQLDRAHFENRLSMVNSILSVSAVSKQGYRPKTKAWQRQ